MTDLKTSTNDNDLLNSRIDSLLNNEGISEEDQKLSPEMDSLLSTAEKVIAEAKRYPGTPTPTAQQRLAIMTAYRLELKKNKVVEQKPRAWFSVLQNTTVRWATVIGVVLLVTIVALLSTPSSGSPTLSGAAGHQSMLYPITLMAVLGLGIILYFIFRRKK